MPTRLMPKRPGSSGRQRESGRTMATWSLTMLSRWSQVRLSWQSLFIFSKSGWHFTAESDHIPPSGPAVRTQTRSPSVRCPPWGCHSNSGQWVQFPGLASLFLSLFPGTILHKGSYPLLLYSRTLRSPLYGPVRTFIKTSQHPGRQPLAPPITWPFMPSRHCSN